MARNPMVNVKENMCDVTGPELNLVMKFNEAATTYHSENKSLL